MKIKRMKAIFIIIIFLIVAIFMVAFRSAGKESPGKYDAFATCLKEKGAVFYGTFWCPHCQNQKKLFGSAEKFLPYIECSKFFGGQKQFCKDRKITSYPTWELSDGTRVPAENTNGVSLETLAQKTSCILP